MACTKPLTAYQAASGSVTFKRTIDTQRQLQLPCGQCIDCKLERTRQWAVRIMHESQLHKHNWFVTLTYNDEENPHTLVKPHLTKFIKRLRHHLGERDERTKDILPRYFACGEYGDRTRRPHYHACLFGLRVTDLKHYSGRGDLALYSSETLDRIWGKGSVRLGQLTFESAAYVAAYCTKKITGPMADDGHYLTLDPLTGELIDREREYAVMSLKPAVGRRWIEKYTNDVFNYDHVIINGKPQKPPRYYDKYLEAINTALFEKHKNKRKEEADKHEADNTTARLQVKAAISKARMQLKRRTL